MDIFMIISLAGGLALFLYGMSMLGSGLEKLSGGRMERTLEKLTKNVFMSVLLGALVTAAIQSSSATTVIVVGLVNAGILKLKPAVGVIMGANIGTTVTAQILRLGDLESDPNVNIFMRFLAPKTLAPLVAIIGILLFMISKRTKVKEFGQMFIGFGILFTGMQAMESAVSPLSTNPSFMQLFRSLSNPIIGVLIGAGVTALIQSSAASIGILQALSSTGAITFSAAFPIIMGQNIGTCITPILSSIGANKNAKRAASVHLYFNVIGTTLFLIGVYTFQHFIGFSFWDEAINKGGIANFHTLFNIIVTIVLIPFSGLLAKLAELTIRDGKQGAEDDLGIDSTALAKLDDRFLISPALAVAQCEVVVANMGKLAKSNFGKTIKLFSKYDIKLAERIREREDAIDKMEDKVNNYLVKLTDRELTDQESKQVTHLLRVVSEFERVGDYSINLMECAEMLRDKEVAFSEKAMRELYAITDAVQEIIDMSLTAFENNDVELSKKIEPLEETIDTMEDTLKFRHIQRLKNGHCTIDAGVVFLEALTNIERISDHCSNIAVYIIGMNYDKESLNRHDYIKRMHQGDTVDYQQYSKLYYDKYFTRIE
ncbi:MAG: Na/Pi cotransporter family protein [Clostridiales bacterium]|nr:Na/Pi cotransporter family protein [Clostridiales bacterium]